MNIIYGFGMIVGGAWLAIAQAKYLWSGKPDSLGGHFRMLMAGIMFVACGIFLIAKNT